ncbi:MAG: DUF5131 family protein, partial [Deltaproteobacteria bacterium]|nr:DUF5131 family protein [Deltaproteobacteria bacterium]
VNRTKIEWCDASLNPQGWGCWGPGGTPDKPQRCWYCYSEDFSERSLSKCELCNQFIPHWHPERLELPYRWKKPRKIFWGSMSDLFHPCTPDWQIKSALAVAEATPRHTHIFCTKNPARYQEFNPWPENCWVGATVENQEAANERLPWLAKVDAKVRFVSFEPLLGPFDSTEVPWPEEVWGRRKVEWVIVGALTGPGSKAHQPKPEWVRSLIDQCRPPTFYYLGLSVGDEVCLGIPLFLKDNLKWPEKIQEWPR